MAFNHPDNGSATSTDRIIFTADLAQTTGFNHEIYQGTYEQLVNHLGECIAPEAPGGILIASPGGTNRCRELGKIIDERTNLRVASVIDEEPRYDFACAHRDLPSLYLRPNSEDGLLHATGKLDLDMPIHTIIIIQNQSKNAKNDIVPAERFISMATQSISNQLEKLKRDGLLPPDHNFNLIQYVVAD